MRRFEYRDEKSAKFWSVDVDGPNIHLAWGRIGTSGQSKTKEFSDPGVAQVEADKLIGQKTKKGYAEIVVESQAATSLEQARSYQRGTLSVEALAELAQTFESEYLTDKVVAMLDAIGGYQGDVYVVDGDLALSSGFDTFKSKVVLLIVMGDFTVNGVYEDYDDPESIVLVHGSMKAKDLLTAGWLEVLGDLTVEGALIGYYNDCGARVMGDARVELFCPEHHYFEVNGAFEATHALGSPSQLKSKNEVPFIEADDPALLQVLADDLVASWEDETDEDDGSVSTKTVVDGFDVRELSMRVRAGRPYRAS